MHIPVSTTTSTNTTIPDTEIPTIVPDERPTSGKAKGNNYLTNIMTAFHSYVHLNIIIIILLAYIVHAHVRFYTSMTCD